MDVGIFSLSDQLNLKKRYLTESDCLLSWTTRDLYINGVKYKNTIGVRIKPGSKFIEIGRPNGEFKVITEHTRMLSVSIKPYKTLAVNVTITYDENF